MFDVFIDPFLECRSEGAHSISSNICSTLLDIRRQIPNGRLGYLNTGKKADMAKLEFVDMLSLDGVMQAPGGPDEDRSGGFEHGGWAMPYFDEVAGEEAGKSMAETGAFLFGRKTYEIMAAYWPTSPTMTCSPRCSTACPSMWPRPLSRGASGLGRLQPVEG